MLMGLIYEILKELDRKSFNYKGIRVNLFGLPQFKSYSRNTFSGSMTYMRKKGLLEYEDSILDSVSHLYQRLRELAISAGNASLGRDDREAVATEMEERHNELQDLVNAKDANGDYLFSGYKSKFAIFFGFGRSDRCYKNK